ncbi:polyprenyl synthetase family protein [Salinibacterium sp. M195]|uniref:polyprenyl synthetase family protein n=1 Tax=Salinibacterium sp. M195 TaxID=2583374 RepID=UPI001C62BDA6|nr:polyprenyl synthetase family protein [Salinibacterium sp. M195]QYH36298.1 polyprenyl synthetase family protein [Salinibacterium sp. M195]
MPESNQLVDLVQQKIDEFLAEKRSELVAIAPELAAISDVGENLLSGGKRFRALFCYWGWQSVAGIPAADDLFNDESVSSELPGVLMSASALELFHAAALVHDDIMDQSDTRRGAPAAHRRFEQMHLDGDWAGSARAYGESSALLLGDLLLGWSDELLGRGLALLPRPSALAARREFMTMRTEVMAGQFLDIHDESAWASYPEPDALERAQRVLIYKSAKYSVEAPLALGASLGAGTDEQIGALRAFGLPLGIAFQLRDDILGVFGDPKLTGKPAGDDLREGKRTAIIAIARQKLSASANSILDELLGDPDLTAEQVDMIRSTLHDSGAIAQIERVIARNLEKACEAIDNSVLAPSARTHLLELAQAATTRTS